ncbi:MAG: hypothetical protein HQK76_17465 [Desulfobacterales bacterium]|nr:hypothetical protein [Desulfobacterales bacterium]
MKINIFKKKGKIIKVKFGYNPNSSSIGIDLTPIIIFGSLFSILVPPISFVIARLIKRRKQKKDQDVV